MSKYSIIKNNNEIHVFGYDQNFTEEDIKSLWEEYNILYIKGGIIAVWIEERKKSNPLFHLMGYDDGHLFWDKQTDKCADVGWLDNYIQTLTELKNKLKR